MLRKGVDWDMGFLAGKGFWSDQPEHDTLLDCKCTPPLQLTPSSDLSGCRPEHQNQMRLDSRNHTDLHELGGVPRDSVTCRRNPATTC
jgi:hypothetical protein